MLYRITRITTPKGSPATDADSLRRIGREGHITRMEVGAPLLFTYAAPDTGALRTTPVVEIRGVPGRSPQATTKQRVYYFREVEARGTDGAVIDQE